MLDSEATIQSPINSTAIALMATSPTSMTELRPSSCASPFVSVPRSQTKTVRVKKGWPDSQRSWIPPHAPLARRRPSATYVPSGETLLNRDDRRTIRLPPSMSPRPAISSAICRFSYNHDSFADECLRPTAAWAAPSCPSVARRSKRGRPHRGGTLGEASETGRPEEGRGSA